MATYGQLLLDDGGGIINPNKQSARRDEATLIIGLGGTGSNAVKMIKKEVYRQLKPDDPNAEIPEYKNIRYLIVDSDPTEFDSNPENPSEIDAAREFFDISYPVTSRDFAQNNWSQLSENKSFSWLNYENIKPDAAKAGAGGVRQVGRYLLFKRVQDLYSTIENEITLARQDSNSTDVYVHIFAGISGGTGSGTFLDVCYLVRMAMRNLGVHGEEVCGYFFLPDVNLTNPEIMQQPTIQKYIKYNGYAAMQELDYCMNFDKNHDSFKADYGSGIIVDDNNKPVDLCYLISSTNNQGKVLANGYDYAMHVVTDHVISFLSKVELPQGVAANNNKGLTLEGHISNITTRLGTINLRSGAGINYTVLGSSVAEMPLSEIATYLGVKLFDNISGIYDRVPTTAERDEFQKTLKLGFEDLFKEIMKSCSKGIPFDDRFNGSYLKEKGTAPFTNMHNSTYDKNAGEIEKLAKTMMEDLGDYRTNAEGTGTSLISRLYKALYEKFVLDSNFGPFYAKRMLYGENNANILHAVDGLIKSCQERITTEELQEALLKDNLEKARTKAEKVNSLNANARADALKAAYSEYNIHMCEYEAYQKLYTVLEKFRKQIGLLDKELFKVLADIMENLRATFKKNAKILYSEKTTDESTYVYHILHVKDFTGVIDNAIEPMDLNKVHYDMMKHLFAEVDEWITKTDENRIVKIISDFILDEFSDATKKTMTDYLSIKYDTTNMQQLGSAIDKDIMQDKLYARSVPLFWQDPLYNGTTDNMMTLTIPYDSPAIERAGDYLCKTKGASLRIMNPTDRISLMRFMVGVPMYAYNGLELLENDYEANPKCGRHLFEGTIDWNGILPSPIPYSARTNETGRQFEKDRAIAALWNEAKNEGILVCDEHSRWRINLIGEVNIQELENEAGELAENAVIQRLEFKEKLLKIKREAYASISTIEISSANLCAGYEERGSLDYFIKAPVLVDIVRKEMSLRKQLEALYALA